MNSDFEKMMADLRSEYIGSIPKKILNIKEHLTANNRELLRDDFHKLKGTGKTYGIPEVSELGEVVEKLCLNSKIPTENFMALAIAILQRIHEERTLSKPFHANQDSDFQKLQVLVLAHKEIK